jgi:hypothetical protein
MQIDLWYLEIVFVAKLKYNINGYIGFEIFGFPWQPQWAYSFSNIRETIFCVPKGLWSLTRGTFKLTSHPTDLQLIDWLIIYGFTSRSRIFHLYGDVTIAGEGLQNLGLCSALRAFEQGGIFIVPHLLWHGTSVFPVSSEGPPQLVASYDTQGDVEDLF